MENSRIDTAWPRSMLDDGYRWCAVVPLPHRDSTRVYRRYDFAKAHHLVPSGTQKQGRRGPLQPVKMPHLHASVEISRLPDVFIESAR